MSAAALASSVGLVSSSGRRSTIRAHARSTTCPVIRRSEKCRRGEDERAGMGKTVVLGKMGYARTEVFFSWLLERSSGWNSTPQAGIPAGIRL